MVEGPPRFFSVPCMCPGCAMALPSFAASRLALSIGPVPWPALSPNRPAYIARKAVCFPSLAIASCGLAVLAPRSIGAHPPHPPFVGREQSAWTICVAGLGNVLAVLVQAPVSDNEPGCRQAHGVVEPPKLNCLAVVSQEVWTSPASIKPWVLHFRLESAVEVVTASRPD
jgi:hypothetical protein